jgi:hypothetical protein
MSDIPEILTETILRLKDEARARIIEIEKQIECLTEERRGLAEHLCKMKIPRKVRTPKDPNAPKKARKGLPKKSNPEPGFDPDPAF